MTIIRRKHSSRYASFPNSIWEDGRIGVDEKGVLGYLLSRPPNWSVHLSQVGRVMGVGKDRMQRIFRTLIAAGYVTRETIRNENGSFVALEYVIRDKPAPVTDADDDAGDIARHAVAFPPQPEYPAPADPAPARAAAYKGMKILNTDYTKPSSYTESSTAARARPPSTPPPVRSEALQSQIAGRLGRGDVALGWELLGELAPSRLDQLTAQQRSGSLSEESLARVRLELMSRTPA
ncbi:hypothetical protein [Tardiphaga sp. OK245]|uniref:hypothetical protein n=1 Tax=Tardiphaga sp. OK245 TaxID=1855306 RepID=UPI0008A729B8|nr:hypothetical protein [Tardiphaga sp. OK245]SEI01329.1 hypothetical protein SAMN05216367_2928 [Tardiphaga sp. OK245]